MPALAQSAAGAPAVVEGQGSEVIPDITSNQRWPCVRLYVQWRGQRAAELGLCVIRYRLFMIIRV